MTLDVISKADVPPGPLLFHKDYDRCLRTEDLDRAQPVLAHPTCATGMPMPWKQMQKAALEEVPKSRSKVLYPNVKRRVQDMSLRTADIEYAQPKKPTIRPRRRSGCIVDLLTTSYQFASSELPPQPQYRASGRCATDVTDIDGTHQPVSARQQFSDTMRIEDEFRNPRHKASINAAMASLGGSSKNQLPRQAPSCRVDGSQRPAVLREGQPLDPKYHVQVADLSTSMHVRYQSERREMGDDPPRTSREEVGCIEGSAPKAGIRDNGEPLFSLCTDDLAGARPQRRVGALPVHLYGPHGNRPAQSSSLNTADIVGAQADTRLHGRRARRDGDLAPDLSKAGGEQAALPEASNQLDVVSGKMPGNPCS